jgi:ATP-dependent helicase/nuclease subunit A
MTATPQPDLERTSAQRHAADPTHSVWVSASAGSGKTKVLVDRFVRLLLAGTVPERILCLTFTKVAAAEMSERLLRDLGAWARADDAALAASLKQLSGQDADADTMVRARRLFARSLEAPGGLRIQTIHGFCETLLARFPIEAGLRPNFTVIDERGADVLLLEARDAIIRATDRDQRLGAALGRFAGLVNPRQFQELLKNLATERAKLRRALQPSVAAACRRVFGFLGVGEDETERGIIAAASANGAFDRVNLTRATQALLQGSKTDRGVGEQLARWLAATDDERIALFDDQLRIFFTVELELRARLATKAAIARMADVVEVLEREQRRISAVRNRLNALAVAGSTAALLTVGAAILDRYDRAKRHRNLLDYDDLVLESVTLLSQPAIAPWILYKLDGGIDHILVDEAQDTSPEQWQVIANLAEEFFAGLGGRDGGRTVFVVGDEKQSIFSFQGADPRKFSEMREHFRARVTAGQEPWRDVPMALSFRTVPAVLGFVDRVFAETGDGVTADGAWVRHEPVRRGHAGLVELWPPVPRLKETTEAWALPTQQNLLYRAESRLAQRIAHSIRGWLDRREILPSSGRPIAPGDVLILVRRRNLFFEEMVLALKKADVPVAGADRMILAEQLAVQDLVALGRFALLPEDDLTLATILKSPLLGLDEEALFRLAAGRGANSLWTELAARAFEAPFDRAFEFLRDQILARADFVPPFEFYGELLNRGGRERIHARLGQEAMDPIDEFLGRALVFQRERVPSLQGFLHWIERDQSEIKRDMERAKDQVRVMTVHGAKGLEAPIVFLPDTCTLSRPETGLFWTTEANGDELMLWPVHKANDDPTTARVRQEANRAAEREYRRLFYVAMTRAADRLYLGGWDVHTKRPAECWYELARPIVEGLGRPVDLAFDDGAERGWRYEEAQAVATGVLALDDPSGAPPPPLPEWLRRPPAPEPPSRRPLAPSRPDAAEAPLRLPLAKSGERFRRGRIVHRLLQSLPAIAPGSRQQVAAQYLALPAHGLDATQQAALLAETLRVLDDPAFAEVFGADGLAEVPLAGIVGKVAISGQVDRLLVSSDRVLVVDFKSDRDPPADREPPAAYVGQMAAYWAALRAIYPDRPVRCALLWTAGPRLDEIAEPLLAAAAP